MMSLAEALGYAKEKGWYCEAYRVGTEHRVDIMTDDISKYDAVSVVRLYQKHTDAEYISISVVYNRDICQQFVNRLKKHQKGIWNGKTMEEILDIADDMVFSDVKFMLASCKHHHLLEKQGSLYAW